MPDTIHIRYLRRRQIDDTRWDHCIAHAANNIIYGFHYYLDHMAAGRWDALVLGDYEAVMPLTWRRKYGIRYLYQPAFTQQTGIFSRIPLSPTLIDAFLQAASRHFRFAEIFLNYGNRHPALEAKTNFILPLDNPYPQLAAGYTPHLTRNLRLAARAGLRYSADVDLATVLDRFRHAYGSRLPFVREKDYYGLAQLCRYLQDRGQLILRAATAAPQPGQPAQAGEPACLSTILLFRDEHRLYLLQSTTLPAGRENRANHFLLDQVIREWAANPLILDFEGSDIPGIARFYTDFGAVRQPYFYYRRNRLWWPLGYLKNKFPGASGLGVSPQAIDLQDA